MLNTYKKILLTKTYKRKTSSSNQILNIASIVIVPSTSTLRLLLSALWFQTYSISIMHVPADCSRSIKTVLSSKNETLIKIKHARQNEMQLKLIGVIFQRNELVKQRRFYSSPVSQQSATGLMQTARPGCSICNVNSIALYLSWLYRKLHCIITNGQVYRNMDGDRLKKPFGIISR